MRTHLSRRIGRAFTLLELLVVMSIIAILATAGLKGLGAAKEFARRAQAHSDCLNIQLALEDYLMQEPRFPATWSGKLAMKGDFLNTLMGEKGPDNRIGAVYFNTGQVTNQPSARGYVVQLNQFNDPWGTPYQIRLDVEGDGYVPVPSPYHDRLGEELLGREIFVHSAGRDRDFATPDDNVTCVD